MLLREGLNFGWCLGVEKQIQEIPDCRDSSCSNGRVIGDQEGLDRLNKCGGEAVAPVRRNFDLPKFFTFAPYCRFLQR